MKSNKKNSKTKYIVMIALVVIVGIILAVAFSAYLNSNDKTVVRSEVSYFIIALLLALPVLLLFLFIALATGVVEVIGTFIGFFAVSISTAILPFALAFAGGTMLYVISDEMIPETHAHGGERGATYALLVGFCLMLAVDVLLG